MKVMEAYILAQISPAVVFKVVATNVSLKLQQSRPGPIMLFKLPIMLLSNAPKFSLL